MFDGGIACLDHRKTRGYSDEALRQPKKMKQKKVLVFCRPYLVPDYEENIAPLRSEFEFRFLTDGSCPGIVDTRSRFYARIQADVLDFGLEADDEVDVLARCRLLRNLPKPKAVRMLRAMASILREELEQFEPDVVLSHVVDDYVTHTLSTLCRKRGILFVGFSDSYFPGKVQVAQFEAGAALIFRKPDTAEIREVIAEISARNFRQDYLQKVVYSRFLHAKAIVRYGLKRVAFPILGLLRKDPLHMHYASLPFVVERRHWRDYPSVGSFHDDWQRRIQTSGKPKVYFPLGYFPESTTDYWVSDKKFIDYEATVLSICEALTPNFCVVVKEHVHMLGARNSSFYRKLLKCAGVISVPPTEYSNVVLEHVDIVLVGGGSIGVEAFLRQKAIASFCTSSYWFAPAGATRVDPSALETWPTLLSEAIVRHTPRTAMELEDFVGSCLATTMRELRTGRVWPICNPTDLRDVLNKNTLARSTDAH